jgi:hypothetical protein
LEIGVVKQDGFWIKKSGKSGGGKACRTYFNWFVLNPKGFLQKQKRFFLKHKRDQKKQKCQKHPPSARPCYPKMPQRGPLLAFTFGDFAQNPRWLSLFNSYSSK